MQVQAAEWLSLVRVAAPGSVVEFGKLVSFYRHDNKMNYTFSETGGKFIARQEARQRTIREEEYRQASASRHRFN